MPGVRVMIVEADRQLADELTSRLAALGLDPVGVADTPAAAMALAGRTRPDLMVIDVGLEGGGDGIETAAAIHGRFGTPVIYLSAHPDPATIERARHTDPVGFLVKPFDDRQLRATLSVARGQADRRAASDEAMYRMFDSLPDLVQSVAADDTFVYTNRAWQRTLGYDALEASALTWWDVVAPASHEACRATLARLRSGEPVQRVSTVMRTREGRDVPVEGTLCLVEGLLPVTRGIFRDMRESQRLAEAARRDPLTGCLNRRGLSEVVAKAIERAAADAQPFAVLLVDLDGFKPINDSYGHDAGDEVLKEIAYRIANVVRPGDAVGRYGGDEFLVALPGAGPSVAEAVAERIRAAVTRAPVAYGPHRLAPAVSIGAAAVRSAIGLDIRALVAEADTHLYQAKRAGRNRVESGTSAPNR